MCVPYPFCTSSCLSLLVVSQMHIDLPNLRAITHPMHPRGSSVRALEQKTFNHPHTHSFSQVDMDAGDFNGTAWRCRSRNNLSY